MKKSFLKISALLTIAWLFSLSGGFCLPNLPAALIPTKTAQAAVMGIETASAVDTCGLAHSAEPVAAAIVFVPPAMPNSAMPSNSLMPCCVDGGHSGTALLAPSLEPTIKLLPTLFFAEAPLLLSNFSVPVAYQSPLILPPKLLAVTTTVLRL